MRRVTAEHPGAGETGGRLEPLLDAQGLVPLGHAFAPRERADLQLAGLPGVPVVDEVGAVLGFVSRTDLLRALATDPPLDLWG